MKTAQLKSAVTKGLFYFRKDPCGSPCHKKQPIEAEFDLMEMDTIINGKVINRGSSG